MPTPPMLTTHRSSAAYSPDAILAMDYNQLIGLVRETNRPPGALASIRHIVQEARLQPSDRVLEVGTSTGFTAIELARLARCHVHAIDINPVSLDEAARRAHAIGLGDRIHFEQRDALSTGYPDASFDLVFCGNVTSLVRDRDAALREYQRVLTPHGFIAAIPMYYRREPSPSLLRAVSDAIHVPIEARDRAFWMNFFTRDRLTPYWSADFAFDDIDDARLDSFTDDILARPHLQELDEVTRTVLATRYREFIRLFRENLSIMGFTVMLLRREPQGMDEELFTSSRVRAE